MNVSLAKQRGHAALLFAMMIPAFFAVFILASDGARALQSKARLEDASEVAVLAIAARNADDKSINNEIVKDYISQYMNDMASVPQLEVEKLSCELIPECVKNEKQGKVRFFQYQIHTKTEHLSWFPGKDAIAGFGEKFTVAGSATARKSQSEAVDVMFVTDFSGSMMGPWDGGEQVRYLDLLDIISEVTRELKKFNELSIAQTSMVGSTTFTYYTSHQDPQKNNGICYVSQRILDGRHMSNADTVKKIFKEKECTDIRSPDEEGYHPDIELTSDLDLFIDTINSFFPKNNGTASFEGIIRGAQLLIKGKNARRLLIVLSDGDDSDKPLSAGLVTAGMCSTIKTELNKGFTKESKKIKARLAVIGFVYDPKTNSALSDCVGEDNVYKAENRDDILNKILELITEEIGHLK